MVVKKGNTIRVEYVGSFESGEVFDSSEKHGEALEFVAGEGQVVPGFDAAVIGMDVGEEKKVTLKPGEAYGEVYPNAMQRIPKDRFPTEIEVGMMIGIPLPNGQQIPAVISRIDDEDVTIDMNHPMAGKTLVFEIKIVSIE